MDQTEDDGKNQNSAEKMWWYQVEILSKWLKPPWNKKSNTTVEVQLSLFFWILRGIDRYGNISIWIIHKK